MPSVVTWSRAAGTQTSRLQVWRPSNQYAITPHKISC